MIARIASALSPRLAGALALLLSLSMAILGWFGYRAMREWQLSAALLTERRAQEAADLLATAVTRDMRAVQMSILGSQDWDELMLEPPYDVSRLVATAFARYPYPESFFAWHESMEPGALRFFSRVDRPPAWRAADVTADLFPVTVSSDPAAARHLMDRIEQDLRQEHRYSIFETVLGGVPYQIVVRLRYADPYRLRLSSAFGFMVNLDWAREHYFHGLALEVERVRGDSIALRTAVHAASNPPDRRSGGVAVGQRPFSLMFFDPLSLAPGVPVDLSREVWVAEATVVDDTPRAASFGARQAIVVTWAAGAMFALGLALTLQIVRANAALVKRRADFVSSVTHELKTPVAAIRAAGETLMSGRLTTPAESRDYARLVIEQAKRLTRLLENLLVYARIIDATEGYSFEPVSLDEIVDQCLRDWKWQLESGGFDVQIDFPAELPRVKGDRTALELLIDNLIANAVTYSTETRAIRISARHALLGRAGQAGQAGWAGQVTIEVADSGIGIPADELRLVTRKFFRGRRSNPGGSGLGLAIADRIVAEHGGSLSIESTVDAGTTVRVTLPVMERDDEAAHPHR